MVNIFEQNNNTELEDIVVTVNNEDLNKIERITVTDDIYNEYQLQDNCITECSALNCTICLNQIIINDKMIKLSCKHIYHEDCIITYLSNYNHKCPICRMEIGTPKYNLD